MTITPEKKRILEDIFWDMHSITYEICVVLVIGITGCGVKDENNHKLLGDESTKYKQKKILPKILLKCIE